MSFKEQGCSSCFTEGVMTCKALTALKYTGIASVLVSLILKWDIIMVKCLAHHRVKEMSAF